MFQIVAEASRLRKTTARRRNHFTFSSVASLNLWLKISTVTLFSVAILFLSVQTQASPPKTQVERLISAARIYDEAEMKTAIEAIISIGGPAIPELRPALKDFDDNVRWQAIIAIGRIGAPARGEVHRIVQALGDDDSDVRAAAAEALGMLKVDSSDVLQALKKHLKDEHGIVRASANWALWELQKDKQSIPRLTREFASSDWIVTERAVRHLASIGKPADHVLANYLQHKEKPGRQHAAAAIASMPSYSQSIIPVLIENLSDEDPQVARFTAKALGNAGEASVPGIIEVLKTDSPKGKLPAVQALGFMGKQASPALSILLQYLSRNEQSHRLAILHTIGSIGVNQHHAEEKVRSFLTDHNPDLRGAACKTLAQLKVQSAASISQLQKLAEEDPKDFVRQAARNALLSLEKNTAKADFNPKDLDNLEMFLESVKGLAIATNTSKEAYEKTAENTPLDKLWSDQERFPQGTIRWWWDQSPYTKDKKLRPNRVFKTGRDLGQDDHDRPGFIPDGCNGKPCVRGGLIGSGKGEKHNKQPCYFELQLESRDFKIPGSFGLFLLVRPIVQERDATIMGQFHRSVLIQNVSKNRLEWKNLGKPIPLSGEGTFKANYWQFIELHRDEEFNLTCLINGKNVTVGKPQDTNPFTFSFLFNNNKGQGFARHEPFAGDIAALLIYRDIVTKKERGDVRNYFNSIYTLGLKSGF